MVRINYLLQHLAFYNFCRNNTVSPKASLLWYQLFNILNERSEGEDRPDVLSVPYSTLQSLTNMSRQTIWRAGNELKTLGLVGLERGSKDQSRKYVINKLYDDSKVKEGQLSQVFQNSELKHIQKHNLKHIQKHNLKPMLDTYIKHKTKTKSIKNIMSDSGSKTGKPKEKNSEAIKTIIDYLNSATDSSYRSTTKSNQKKINARLEEGFTVDDFKKVIDKKKEDWKGTNMAKFLRPETLFGTKFEGYLNEPENSKSDGFSNNKKCDWGW